MSRGKGYGNSLVGKHIFANLYRVRNKRKLSDKEFLEKLIVKACEVAGSTLYDMKSWKIEGEKGGVSVIALVLESHFAIHTWTEYEYACVDIFSCGGHTNPEKAMQLIVKELKPEKVVYGRAEFDRYGEEKVRMNVEKVS